MPVPQHIKVMAYRLDPDCWESYSGAAPDLKAQIDVRRNAALMKAKLQIDEDSDRNLAIRPS